ncbi:hypothetical protein PHMEG_00017219 [Phytophthora megakarya]|uniref:Eukaryotic/viral aspartic protease n=1 Tax=Phytophthora megakarya TaxID=4795 RepID=A0A225VYL4_9STRA|nr:hypothetical protein PHMEG_00017219 [Phytophthora megakarya]
MVPGPPGATLNPAAGDSTSAHTLRLRGPEASRQASYPASAHPGSLAYVSSGRESHPLARGQLRDLSQCFRGRLRKILQGVNCGQFQITTRRLDPEIPTLGEPGVQEPLEHQRPELDKRRAWWDKFQYTASSGGWRDQELCTRLYSRLSHNPGTKAWVQQLPAPVRRSWRQLSDRFYKKFCRSTESPVGRYLRLKQESLETPQTFLWRLNAPATKANVDYHSTSGCRRHVNQFLKNPRDRELQLSLQGRVYFTTDELEDVFKQVEEMDQGMRRKPANDGTGPGATAPVGSGAYAAVVAPEIPEPQLPDPGDLRWEEEDDSGYGYQYDEENDEAYDGLVDQEEVFRAEVPGSWNDRNGRPQGRSDSRGSGHSGTPRPSVPCAVCNKLGHTRERCWQLMKCDRCGGKHNADAGSARRAASCTRLHPAGECAVIKAFKDAAQRGQLQGLPEEVLQRLRPEATPALNN